MDECNLPNLVSVDINKCILQEYELKGCIAAEKPVLTKEYLKDKIKLVKEV